MNPYPIEPVAPLDAAPAEALPGVALTPTHGFADWLVSGATQVDRSAALADDAVARFALDGSVPPHQVMLALEEARMSLQFALQVRSRLVEGYQELMRMQL
ncbi:flagellar hook-basal body complex protein FliE [Burkholderia perseverans]|uniref:flagellar hook-basal body complex protein FliE n=1 Tax=Burkholderia perseverans TaxID=2615214 RepID=UPI001FEE6F17|nr:flagellar hook-basal body complex protein FliE [Burkholderia perseverans]